MVRRPENRAENMLLRAARERRGLNIAKAARALEEWAYANGHTSFTCSEDKYRTWEMGSIPRSYAWPVLTGFFEMTPEELGLRRDDEPVYRRSFVTLTGSAIIDATTAAVADQLVPTLLRLSTAESGRDLDLVAATAAVRRLKKAYQACRHNDVVAALPELLPQLGRLAKTVDGDEGSAAQALVADAYHVAAGIQLKRGMEGPAWLAADASMRAAEASEDPVTLASSVRIVTHALMDGGHLAAAIELTTTGAARLAADALPKDVEALSVYGSLLLRGSIAAARAGDRQTALSLLAEAHEAARRLGGDANHRWTAFGPTNVRLHRVNVAVKLGDAGTAIEHARAIDPRKLVITERQAALYIDVARAYVQWGKHDRALEALDTAHRLAPEEISHRPSVLGLVQKAVHDAPPTARRQARALAERVGITP